VKSITNSINFLICGFFAVLLVSCSIGGDLDTWRKMAREENPREGGGNSNNPDNPGQKTTIAFDNTNGTCTALIYNSYQRTEESLIAQVPAGKISGAMEYNPGPSIPFFLLYNINLIGIDAFIFEYVPELGRDQVHIRIDANSMTIITIPRLSETVSSSDTLLSNNSYLIIQNNSSYWTRLLMGSSVLMYFQQSDNLFNVWTWISPGKAALYTLTDPVGKDTSIYQLNENERYSSFPEPAVSFEAGRVYSYLYNDSGISLSSVIDMKLENVVSGTTEPRKFAFVIGSGD